jgi:hypothetical protein
MLDNEIEENEEWYNALSEPPKLSPDPYFDEFGDYRHVVSVAELMMVDSVIENSIITDLPSLFSAYEHNISPRAIGYQRYQPNFLFMPPDIIKHTFEKTTQFYRATANPSMKKRYKSPFPACNVHR